MHRKELNKNAMTNNDNRRGMRYESLRKQQEELYNIIFKI